MDAISWFRAICSFGMDLAIAVCAGLLLADVWLVPTRSATNRELQLPRRSTFTLLAGLLLLAAFAQLYLLITVFSGGGSLSSVFAAAPDVLSTHAGSNASTMLVAALLLQLFLLFPTPHSVRIPGASLLLCLCLVLHSGSGHAGADGAFSINRLLQALHLGAMSTWSGGVLVSGLLVVPRLASGLGYAPVPSSGDASGHQGRTGESVRRYLTSLSTVSTWSVAVVILTGVIKSYRALGGDLRQVSASLWGYLLMAKVAVILLALTLGALNRFWIRDGRSWSSGAVSRSARALRLEAWAMLVILLLSAVLGNATPPGE